MASKASFTTYLFSALTNQVRPTAEDKRDRIGMSNQIFIFPVQKLVTLIIL
jgi:hypothetical protein